MNFSKLPSTTAVPSVIIEHVNPGFREVVRNILTLVNVCAPFMRCLFRVDLSGSCCAIPQHLGH